MGTSPPVGLCPKMPLKKAGMRIEPPGTHRQDSKHRTRISSADKTGERRSLLMRTDVAAKAHGSAARADDCRFATRAATRRAGQTIMAGNHERRSNVRSLTAPDRRRCCCGRRRSCCSPSTCTAPTRWWYLRKQREDESRTHSERLHTNTHRSLLTNDNQARSANAGDAGRIAGRDRLICQHLSPAGTRGCVPRRENRGRWCSGSLRGRNTP